MPDPNGMLRVGAMVDEAAAKAGMDRVAQAVHDATTRMKVDFDAAQAATAKAMEEIRAELQKVQMELDQFKNKSHNAMHGHITDVQAASASIRTFEGHIPIRAVEQFTVKMLGLGPIMQAAFPVIGAIAVLEILLKIPAAIADIVDWFRNWNEAAKEAFKEQSEGAARFVTSMLDTKRALDNLGMIGKGGEQKTNAQLKAIQNDINNTNKALRENERALEDAAAAMDKYGSYNPLTGEGSVGAGLPGLSGGGIFNREEYEKAKETLDRTKKTEIELQTRRDALNVERMKGIKEGSTELYDHELAKNRALADQKKQFAIGDAERDVAIARRRAELGQLTAEELVAAEMDGEKRIYAAQLEWANKRNALERKHYEETGKFPPVPISILQLQQDAYKRMEQIQGDSYIKQRKNTDEQAIAMAEGSQKSVEAQTRNTIEGAKILAARGEIDIGEEYRRIRKATDTLLASDENTLSERLRIARQYPVQNAALIINLQKQLEAAERDHITKLLAIDEEGRVKQYEKNKAFLEAEVNLVQETSNRELAFRIKKDNDEFAHGEISRSKWIKDEKAAIQQWADDQIAEHKKVQKFLESQGQGASLAWKKESDKIIEIDQQRYQKQKEIQDKALDGWRQWGNQVTGIMFSSVNQWIQGQKTFTQALVGMWNGLVMSIIESMEKMAAKWIVEHLIMAAVAKIFHVEDVAGTTAATATKVAENAAANELMAVSDAALAAAAAFASVMEDMPYPANVIQAPIVAGTVFATGLEIAALAALDTGGVTTKDGIAMLHQDEVVLDKNLTNFVRDAASSSSGSGGAFHYHAAAGESPQSIDRNIAALGRAYRDGRIPRFK